MRNLLKFCPVFYLLSVGAYFLLTRECVLVLSIGVWVSLETGWWGIVSGTSCQTLFQASLASVVKKKKSSASLGGGRLKNEPKSKATRGRKIFPLPPGNSLATPWWFLWRKANFSKNTWPKPKCHNPENASPHTVDPVRRVPAMDRHRKVPTPGVASRPLPSSLPPARAMNAVDTRLREGENEMLAQRSMARCRRETPPTNWVPVVCVKGDKKPELLRINLHFFFTSKLKNNYKRLLPPVMENKYSATALYE